MSNIVLSIFTHVIKSAPLPLQSLSTSVVRCYRVTTCLRWSPVLIPKKFFPMFFCAFKYIFLFNNLFIISNKKFLEDVFFISGFYYFSTCFFNFSRTSSGVVEAKSFTTFSRDFPPLSRTTSLFLSARTLERYRQSSALASPSDGGAAIATLTASAVRSVTAFCLEPGLAWMAMVTQPLGSTATGPTGGRERSGPPLRLLP